jgi:hypothetical protein
MRKLSNVILMIGVLVVAVIIQAQLPVNPTLENGNFEEDLTVGWRTGGYVNYSVSRVPENGNHIAILEVGEGPIGDDCCTNPYFNNFAYLDQLFTLKRNRCVELDFDVPVLGIPDPSENANCSVPGFDRVEMDFLIVQQDPWEYHMTGVVTIDYIASTGATIGRLQVNDFIEDTVSSVEFDPMSSTPVQVGPLSLTKSKDYPFWFHASMEVSTDHFSWLPKSYTFGTSARLEDNRRTGRDFSIKVDNVLVRPCGVTQVEIDIKPGPGANRIKPGNKGSIPVAILTTDDFDASTVDAATVKFGPDGAPPRSFGHLQDVDDDGDIDLLFLFRTRDTGIQCGNTIAVLTGLTFERDEIRGEDSIATAGCR